MAYYYDWKPYVPVAVRRQRAARKMQSRRKKGLDVQPIEIQGRKIARSFWGEAWCNHMESLGDFENRLPRGRTYVRNGSVCHLAIKKGEVTAIVSGSELYDVKVKIAVLPAAKWKKVKNRCSGQIGSLLELLGGTFSDNVMKVVTNTKEGMFPLAKEIRMACSCPDWATMCKHVAAVLYGVGARLDDQPELLFLLRGVDHQELVDTHAQAAVNRVTGRGGRRKTLTANSLNDVFGIELDNHRTVDPTSDTSAKRRARRKKRATTRARATGSVNGTGVATAERNTTKRSTTKNSRVKKSKTTASKKSAKKKKAVPATPKATKGTKRQNSTKKAGGRRNSAK